MWCRCHLFLHYFLIIHSDETVSVSRACVQYYTVFSPLLVLCAAYDAFTCGSGGEARRDGAAGTAWTSRTNPHHLVLTLQTDDLVFLIFSHLAGADVLAPGLDLHACIYLTDQSHVCSCIMLQHPPRRSLLITHGSHV